MIQTEIDLNGRVAIVTGAGRGIGAATALALAAAGARVAVNDINPDRAEQTAAQIRTAGGTAIGIGADVANKFQCVTLIEETREKWGRLDILVNNAAVAPKRSILKMDEWDWQRCIDVNLKGTFFMSQLCGRVMSDENSTQGGAIVNVAATAGVLEPRAGYAAYGAAKAGVVGFARECAREFAPYGIRVNTVLPDHIDTPGTADLQADPAVMARLQADIPLGRLGTADECARVILFLCAPASAYLTGSTITIDGGRLMR